MSELKGFIHNQIDLPFTFDGDLSNSIREAKHFRKCYIEVIKYLNKQEDKPKEDELILKKIIDTSKLKYIIGLIHREYVLNTTTLIKPDTNSLDTQTHSHTKNGYFNFLIKNSIKEYSFKFIDGLNRERYFQVHVDNNKSETRIELHLSTEENKEIKDRLKKHFNN